MLLQAQHEQPANYFWYLPHFNDSIAEATQAQIAFFDYFCSGTTFAPCPFSAFFHSPLLEKQFQPHFSQLSSDAASQNDQINISNL